MKKSYKRPAPANYRILKYSNTCYTVEIQPFFNLQSSLDESCMGKWIAVNDIEYKSKGAAEVAVQNLIEYGFMGTVVEEYIQYPELNAKEIYLTKIKKSTKNVNNL